MSGPLRVRARARRGVATGAVGWVGLVAVTTVAAALAGCTTAAPPGLVDRSVSVTPAPFLTTIDGMTAVPGAVECVNERLDDHRSALPGPQLFPPAFPGVVSVRLIRPGRDASDPACRATLMDRFRCRDATTWAVPDPAEFLDTFGARQVKIVEGASAARTRSTEDGLGPGPSKRSFAYAEYALPAGDPRGAVAFEQHAYATCSPGPERVLDGVAARTATVGTDTGLTDVAFLAVGDRLAMLALSGSRWAADERDRAWQVVAQHLQQEG